MSDRAGRDRLQNSRWGFESNCFVCEERNDSGLRIPLFHDRDDDAVVAVVLHRPHLRHTIAITLAVGSVVFCINQLDVVLRGDATAMVWGEVGGDVSRALRRLERRRARRQPARSRVT